MRKWTVTYINRNTMRLESRVVEGYNILNIASMLSVIGVYDASDVVSVVEVVGE